MHEGLQAKDTEALLESLGALAAGLWHTLDYSGTHGPRQH